MAAEPRPTPADDPAPPPDQRGARSRGVTLEARGLRATYGPMVALEDLSLTARAGEVLGLLGPNGAGKTTAIRVLTTLVRPSAGVGRGSAAMGQVLPRRARRYGAHLRGR